MEMNQWTLVARVMEFIVDHDVKHQVIERAMKSREGSVVWRCLSTMQNYRLSEEERKTLFQQAMDFGMWQLVKPLVELKDSTGIKHRDTAMVEAIEQRQWDVVDYCQLYDADIDIKDWNGETPLNKEARRSEWRAVDELVVRGADPNRNFVFSILNRAISEEEWGTSKLLIEYLANIHKPTYTDEYFHQERTPLQCLIDFRQGELIHHTLMWCPDQAKGVNDFGETTLHAIVLDKDDKILYNQVVRGVDPLNLTKKKQSVLLYAVLNSRCPQRMVAECIRLGFSIHQPALTKQSTRDISKSLRLTEIIGEKDFFSTSPILVAVVRGQHKVAHMLYESGSSSPKELLHMYKQLLKTSGTNRVRGRQLLESINEFCRRWMNPNKWQERKRAVRRKRYDKRTQFVMTFLPYLQEIVYESRSLESACHLGISQWEYHMLMKNITTFLPCFKAMVSTPRSLKSTCRLAISRCLKNHLRREKAVLHLSTLDDAMKNYLLFSDLTDPHYHPTHTFVT
jgi:hypothetical protein